MPSKLRRAIGAVKDQTSIGLAKVATRPTSALHVAILKATSHDEVPAEDRHVAEVLLMVSSSQVAASSAVHAISRRIARTRDWVIALKSLSLAFHALRDGGPYFSLEALAAARRPAGRRLLDLSDFSTFSASWDFTAFVRTFALYVETRLECYVLGKLNLRHRHCQSHVANMKPASVLDRIGYWQGLIGRAIGTRPTGPARTNRLVQFSLYPVLRESFDLYQDITDGLSLLLDNFFHLSPLGRRDTSRACATAAKQFKELELFYDVCQKIGVGRSSEYPTVQKISTCLIETLEEVIKDQRSSTAPSPSLNCRSSPLSLLLAEPMNHLDGRSSKPTEQWGPDILKRRPNSSRSNEQDNGRFSELVLFEEKSQASQAASDLDDWELELMESVSSSSIKEAELSSPEDLKLSHSYSNPFLEDFFEQSLIAMPNSAVPAPPPTFQAKKSDDEIASEAESDPFSSSFQISSTAIVVSDPQQMMLREKQLWMENQSKIIAKNMTP